MVDDLVEDANQQKILPMGRLPGVVVDIEGVNVVADSEVIKIVDDSNSYLTLLRLDWAFDTVVIINFKKRQMVFEKDNMRVIFYLDPSEGVCYTNLVWVEYFDADVDNIYQITTKEEDWINLTAQGKLSWEHDSSCTFDSKEELEN